MGWAVASLVGFALACALVVVLARSTTARWERTHRAARAPRGPAPRPAGAAARLRSEFTRRLPSVAGRLPHRLHLPSRVVTRLPHPHVPALHLPHPHLPHVRLPHVPVPPLRRPSLAHRRSLRRERDGGAGPAGT